MRVRPLPKARDFYQLQFFGEINMKKLFSTAVVALFLSAFALPALAVETPFGKGFGGWKFTQENLGRGVTNCRAHKPSPDQDQYYIIGYRTNEDNAGYFSMTAKGIKGKYPSSQMTFSGGVMIDVTAEADGKRLWVLLGDPDLEKVAQEGGFVLNVGDLGAIEVNMGPRTGEAYQQAIKCVEANR